MTRSVHRLVLAALASCLLISDRDVVLGEVTFENDVRPIFKAACFHCHGESDERNGELDVRLTRLLIQGGESGPAIVAGDSASSLLWQRIRDAEMPPEPAHQLTARQIETVQQWIDAGALTESPEPATIDDMRITEQERRHWSFQSVRRPQVPDVSHQGRVRTPIDAFILRKLNQNGFQFSEDAESFRLLRRVTIDLLGLPPTPAQVEAFLDDKHPRRYERLVDRLLSSPNYGERWGRHWLDVAGYADSEGYNIADAKRPHAWRYRDYVIGAWNEDLPFDRFVVEQLAGDEMIRSPIDNLTPEEGRLLIATGFLRTSPDGTGGSVDDANVARNAVVAGTMQVVSSSLLGLTVACAQCHDHRYDPIPQSDYYQLRAVFDPAFDWKKWRNPKSRLVSLYTDKDRQVAAEIEVEAKAVDATRTEKQSKAIADTLAKQIEKLPESIREAARVAKQTPPDKQTDAQKKLIKQNPSLNVTAGSLYLYDRKAADELKALAEQAASVRARKPLERMVRATTEPVGSVPKSVLFARGDHNQPKQELGPAGLTVVSLNTSLPPIAANDSSLATTGRRLALAARLTDQNHPLLARVIVNRIWMHHFGRGIVATPGDFGKLGTPPTHPELLDWLASEFIQSGWSVKHIHRLILRSTTYRQSLRVDARQDDVDPDNLMYGGAKLRRLNAETFRDSILALAGHLNLQFGGEPVPVMADEVGRWVLGSENIKDGRAGAVVDLAGQQYRRSVYVEARRSRPLSVLDAFDWPTMTPNCQLRRDSTVATQSLMLMNSDLVVQCAQKLAERVRAECGDNEADGLRHLWKLVYGRDITGDEFQSAHQFVLSTKTDDPFAVISQMLLCSNEFLYVD